MWQLEASAEAWGFHIEGVEGVPSKLARPLTMSR